MRRGGGCDGDFWREGAGYGVDAVEGASEDEVVVRCKSGGAGEAKRAGCLGFGVRGGGGCAWGGGGEGAVEDKGAGFGDYEEGEDGPVWVS